MLLLSTVGGVTRRWSGAANVHLTAHAHFPPNATTAAALYGFS